MSLTFKYSFTNAQDFCARKGNKISLSYYWIISIYMVQKCWYICGWNAFAIFTKGHPFPLALTHMISSLLRPFFLWRSAKIFIALSLSVSWNVTTTKIVSQDLPLTERFHLQICLVFQQVSALTRVSHVLESRLVDGWICLDSRSATASTGLPYLLLLTYKKKKCWPKFFC